MRNRQSRQKKPWHFDWLRFGVTVIFVLAVLTAILLFIVYPRLKTLPAPTDTPQIIPTDINAATLTFTPFPQPLPTFPSSTPQIYLVKQGDTLSSIALQFGVSVDDLRAANALTSDLIFLDQPLRIPGNQSVITSPAPGLTGTLVVNSVTDSMRYQVESTDTLESIATSHGLEPQDVRDANSMIGDTLIAGQFITIPLAPPVALPAWKFSRTNGDFNQAYPLSFDKERFTLHYQPETFPAQDPDALAQLELNGLNFLESQTGLVLENKYDLYVAGSTFEPPNQALRGITFSSALKTFLLHDGTGNSDDQQYIASHELTHLFLWNTIGSPSSTMLAEGAAVFMGMEMIKNSEHMPIETFCAAYLQAGALPDISGSLSFLGHISDMQNYYSAGCFVKYLVDTYGMESLKLVYHSGDYMGVYGKDIYGLESDSRIHLATIPIPDGMRPTELVGSVKDLEDSYRSFFSSFTGASTQRDAYRELDKARIALLQGKLMEMHDFLNQFSEVR